MLLELRVDNYVLIKSLRFKPQSGFNIITGETGAGKSILIGALGLILGERADSKTVSGNEKKCIIEGVFNIKALGLRSIFESYDLDYSEETILRREILISGKSRAFINDTPVGLSTLKEVGSRLVDIHSQHQTLLLRDQDFTFNWLDVVSGLKSKVVKYYEVFVQLKEREKQISELRELVQSEVAEKDYHQFLYNELEQAQLDTLNSNAMEEEYEVLQNAEEIGTVVAQAVHGLQDGEDTALERMNVILKQLQKLSSGGELTSLAERLASSVYELEEVVNDLRLFGQNAQPNPERLEELNELTARLHALETKHRVTGVAELIVVREDLSDKLSSNESREQELAHLESEITQLRETCIKLAEELHQKRLAGQSELEVNINKDLNTLGLVNASIGLELDKTKELNKHGLTQFDILFASNVGSVKQPAHKVASGGELSRLMLILKSYLAKNQNLPSIIFDEIDTGVSGEVSLKMAEVMTELAKGMQVISITHLPQVASKGQTHFYVYKQLDGERTATFVKELNQTDRIIELAKMLSGDNPSEGAIANAKELLN